MSVIMRILLISASVMSALYIFRRIRRAQMKIKDSIVWLLFCALLIILSIFPQLADVAAKLLGVASPVNLVYLVIIFFLIMMIFGLSTRIARAEESIQVLSQRIAIDDRLLEESSGIAVAEYHDIHNEEDKPELIVR